MHWLDTIRDSSIGLVALKNVIIFASGVGCTVLYYRWKDRRDDMVDPEHAPHITQFKRLWIYAGLGLCLFAFITVRTQLAADHSETALNWTRQQAADAKATASHNKDCFNHLADVMRQRGKLSDAIDPALQKQIDELGTWLADMATPPPDIANTHTTDLRYQEYAAEVGKKYSALLAAERADAAANAKIRTDHPVPDPSCAQ